MARRPDPARIETARRAAVIARLWAAGHPAAEAAALVDDFVSRALPPARVDWDAFDDWLAARGRRSQTRAPPGGDGSAATRQRPVGFHEE